MNNVQSTPIDIPPAPITANISWSEFRDPGEAKPSRKRLPGNEPGGPKNSWQVYALGTLAVAALVWAGCTCIGVGQVNLGLTMLILAAVALLVMGATA